MIRPLPKFGFALLLIIQPALAAAVPHKDLAAAQILSANKAALREPTKAGFIEALQIYPFAEGAIYRLYAAPGVVTDIGLQPGEAVTSVAAGDTARWTVGDTTSGRDENKRTHILIKPFAAGLATNLIIATDRRTYHLELRSTARTAMSAISWTYPLDDLIALKQKEEAAVAAAPAASGIAPETLNFNYAISGDRPDWRPVRAFDDGRQTYVEFPPGVAAGEVPPLFVLGSTGEAELVNYRMSGRYFIVDRLFSAAELRLGAKHQQVVRIIRTEAASHPKGRRHD